VPPVSLRLPPDPLPLTPGAGNTPRPLVARGDPVYDASSDASASARALADALPLIVWTAGPDGQATSLNRRWESYTGQSAADGVAHGTDAFVHPDDLAGIAAAWRERLPGGAQAGQDFTVEYRLRDRHGEYRWHLGRVVARRGPGGEVVEWVGTSGDIHAQKLAERAVAESNAQLREIGLALELSNQQLQDQAIELEAANEELQATATALEERTEAAEAALDALRELEDRFHVAQEVSPNGFQLLRARRDAAGALVDLDYVYINGAGARLVHHTPEEMVGRGMTELFPRVRAAQLFDEYARVVESGTPFEREIVYPHEGPETRVLHVSAVRVGDGLAIASVDVTDRVRALEAAERAREEAARERDVASAANQAKAQFLAAMSHELRTPLNAIGGYVQLIDLGLHGPVTGEQQAALGRVTRAQQHLLGLINDILNYAKLESGRVEYAVDALDVRDVVAEVTPLVEPQLATRELGFDVVFPGVLPAVWADREKLRQVLLNLLSNAAKFTEPGGRVLVDVATRDTGAGGGRPDLVFVRVTDTGVGVPRDKQESIFEPFVQVRATVGRLHEGTGLGLAISRDLARGMGGDLRVRSAPGLGSTFTLALRRVVAADGTPTDRRVGTERRDDDERRAPEDRRGTDPALQPRAQG